MRETIETIQSQTHSITKNAFFSNEIKSEFIAQKTMNVWCLENILYYNKMRVIATVNQSQSVRIRNVQSAAALFLSINKRITTITNKKSKIRDKSHFFTSDGNDVCAGATSCICIRSAFEFVKKWEKKNQKYNAYAFLTIWKSHKRLYNWQLSVVVLCCVVLCAMS